MYPVAPRLNLLAFIYTQHTHFGSKMIKSEYMQSQN